MNAIAKRLPGHLAAVGALLALAAADAQAQTRMGSGLAAPGDFIGCNVECTVSQSSAPGVRSTAPASGRITRWNVRSASAPFRLVVIRGGAVVASGPVETRSGGPYSASIPIQAGDRIGLTISAGGGFGALYSAGATLDRWEPALGAAPRTPEYNTPEGYEVLLGATITTAGGGGRGTTITVLDDYFAPKAKTVARGTTVTWTWHPTDTSHRHNVTFVKVPRGARRGRSTTKRDGTYSRKFTRRGTYRYVCTIHRRSADMRGTVRVR
jgi:plastocyanin